MRVLVLDLRLASVHHSLVSATLTADIMQNCSQPRAFTARRPALSRAAMVPRAFKVTFKTPSGERTVK
jgi:hypothetical protein